MHACNRRGRRCARPGQADRARGIAAAPADVRRARMPARELLKAKIHSAEGRTAAEPRSAAARSGPYQFEPRTWVSLFKRRYPGDTRSFDQIAALRDRPAPQRRADQRPDQRECGGAAPCRFRGERGNLYLAHVLGHDRAVTVLRADPTRSSPTCCRTTISRRTRSSRPTAPASLVHWAYGKMGDKGVPGISPPEPLAGRRGDRGAGEGARSPSQSRPGGSTSRRFTATSAWPTARCSSPSCSTAPRSMRRRSCASSGSATRRRLRAGDVAAPRRSARTSISTRSMPPARHGDAEAIGEALGLAPARLSASSARCRRSTEFALRAEPRAVRRSSTSSAMSPAREPSRGG
jgi:hypothetical protein